MSQQILSPRQKSDLDYTIMLMRNPTSQLHNPSKAENTENWKKKKVGKR